LDRETDKKEIKDEFAIRSGLKNLKVLKYLALAGQLGVVMIISILLWLMLSRYLIRLTGIGEIWQAAGVILGVFTGMMGSYQLLKRIIDSQENHD